MKKIIISILAILLFATCNSKKNKPVEFKTIDFVQDIPLVEGSADSIHYHVEFHFTEITDYQNKEALNLVKTELNKRFFNAEKLEFFANPEDNFKTYIEAITPAYREEGAQIKKDVEEMSYVLNYELIKSSKAVYNQHDILIIEIETYVYAGGAHGLSNMQYIHFDMASGETFGLEEIFGPGSNQKIAELLLEKSEEMKQAKESMLFDDAKAEINENFYFDDKNFYFVYNPYEIGPYAAGYITVELPIESVRDLIVKDGPLAYLVIK